jgi:Holliday junction resolvase RusA-like endonuclease
MILFEIPGCPVPWAASKVGPKMAYDPKGKDKLNITWHIRLQAQKMQQAWPLKGAVRLDTYFFMQIAHNTPAKRRQEMLDGKILHAIKPDRTNMLKLYEDCLERAGVIKNDSSVVCGIPIKTYGAYPKVILVLRPVKDLMDATGFATPKDLEIAIKEGMRCH